MVWLFDGGDGDKETRRKISRIVVKAVKKKMEKENNIGV
jgi:hypothetical protein